ncbi:hypothetical protein F5146DRAFT_1006815 [Armillaria mellea]|nr:hypothetical protein F5146DRAFT_1006815 [Armillaria mellea]
MFVLSGGAGPLVRSTVEDVSASFVAIELEGCDVFPHDFAGMAPMSIRRLSISAVVPTYASFWDLWLSRSWKYMIQSPWGCMYAGATLRRLMDGCQDSGCCDIVHLTHAVEFSLVLTSQIMTAAAIWVKMTQLFPFCEIS